VNQHLLRATFTVFAFWWSVLFIWWFLDVGSPVLEAWHKSLSMFGLCAMGLACGMGLAWYWVWTDKQRTRALLQGETIRGLGCSIGELPIIAKEPARAERMPDWSAMQVVSPNLQDDWLKFFPEWFAKYGSSHPGHCALMRALLCIYEEHKTLPATHIAGGHGGRSLLEHSLCAGYYMNRLARSWKYTGLRDRKGNRVLLPLRDANYKFNQNDPLAAIIGVAHDIGKIEAFIYDSDSSTEGRARIVGIHHEHDLTGARMLARMPEAWQIPDEDRRAIFLAIAHYHHPMELPLSPDRRGIDDRTIALMELLIRTDFVTARIEADGVEPTEQEYEERGAAAGARIAIDVTSTSLWSEFVELLGEAGRINSSDVRFNIGTYCTGNGFAKPMLLLKEDAVRKALMSRLDLEDSGQMGDGRHQLTVDLMKLLDERRILYRSHDGTTYSYLNAIWDVDFLKREAGNAIPKKHTGWSAVIVIDPKEFPSIEEIPVYWWFAQINHGLMGGGRAINKAAAKSATTSTTTPASTSASTSASPPGSNTASKPASPKNQGSANPGRKAGRKENSVSLSDMDENELDETIGLPFRDFDGGQSGD
jgi:hypothetical protein